MAEADFAIVLQRAWQRSRQRARGQTEMLWERFFWKDECRRKRVANFAILQVYYCKICASMARACKPQLCICLIAIRKCRFVFWLHSGLLCNSIAVNFWLNCIGAFEMRRLQCMHVATQMARSALGLDPRRSAEKHEYGMRQAGSLSRN